MTDITGSTHHLNTSSRELQDTTIPEEMLQSTSEYTSMVEKLFASTAVYDDDGNHDVTEMTPVSSTSSASSLCRWWLFMVTGVFLLLLGMVGLLGNIISFKVLWKDRKKSATSTLLLFLSVTDSVVCVIYPLLLSLPLLGNAPGGTPNWAFVDFLTLISPMMWPIANTCHILDCWLILVISVQRYLAVCWPTAARYLNTSRSALLQGGITVCIAVIYNIPRFWEFTVITLPSGRLTRIYTVYGKTWSYAIGYQAIAGYLLIYMIPLSVMLFTTIRMIQKLGKGIHKKAEVQPLPSTSRSTRISKVSKQKNDITLAVVVVVVIYMLCQLFQPIRRIMLAYLHPDKLLCPNFFFFYKTLVSVVIVFNSSVNFYVFCLCAPGFRRQVMACLSLRNNTSGGEMSVMSGKVNTVNTVM